MTDNQTIDQNNNNQEQSDQCRSPASDKISQESTFSSTTNDETCQEKSVNVQSNSNGVKKRKSSRKGILAIVNR